MSDILSKTVRHQPKTYSTTLLNSLTVHYLQTWRYGILCFLLFLQVIMWWWQCTLTWAGGWATLPSRPTSPASSQWSSPGCPSGSRKNRPQPEPHWVRNHNKPIWAFIFNNSCHWLSRFRFIYNGFPTANCTCFCVWNSVGFLCECVFVGVCIFQCAEHYGDMVHVITCVPFISHYCMLLRVWFNSPIFAEETWESSAFFVLLLLCLFLFCLFTFFLLLSVS